MFNAYIFIFQFLCFVFSRDKRLVETSGYVNLIDRTRRSGDLGHLVDFALDRRFQGIQIHTGTASGSKAQARPPVPQGLKKMFNFDLLIAVSGRECLSGANRFLCFFGESVDVHLATFLPSLKRDTDAKHRDVDRQRHGSRFTRHFSSPARGLKLLASTSS